MLNFIKIGQTVADIWPFNGFFKMAAVRRLDDYWRPLFRNPSKGRVNLDIAVRAQPMQGQGKGLWLGLVFGG